jgi:FemAB-related protein (PEP-CTERM system-associated)
MSVRPLERRAPDVASSGAPSAAAAELGVTEAGPADRPDWDGYVARAQGAELYHDYRWRTVLEEVFAHECTYLIARDAGRVCGVLPLARLKSMLFGDFLVSLPCFNYGGVLAESEAAAQTLLAAAAGRARDLGVAHIELRHRDRDDVTLPARDDKVTMVLRLPATAEALWQDFPGKLRSQIRRPQKAGATVRNGGAELLDDFYRVFARNMRDLGTPVYPASFFAAVLRLFAHEARMWIVDLGGETVAAALTLTHRSVTEVPWASALREGNRVSANMLLYWSLLEHATEHGCHRFDFGRCTKNSGTFKFKEQWGAEPQQLRWHYWLAAGRTPPMLNPSNPKYELAIAVWKRLPLPIANWLGPRIVKSLP